MIVKSEWPRGSWDDEPDRLEWRDEATGLTCLMIRQHHGAWCGYVAVTRGHPAYEKHYDDPALQDVDVHGGLTYADHCREKICHVPAPGELDDVWWLGFDCCHGYDVVPSMRDALLEYVAGSEYRDLAYVKGQVTSLASQLKAMCC